MKHVFNIKPPQLIKFRYY